MLQVVRRGFEAKTKFCSDQTGGANALTTYGYHRPKYVFYPVLVGGQYVCVASGTHSEVFHVLLYAGCARANPLLLGAAADSHNRCPPRYPGWYCVPIKQWLKVVGILTQGGGALFYDRFLFPAQMRVLLGAVKSGSFLIQRY